MYKTGSIAVSRLARKTDRVQEDNTYLALSSCKVWRLGHRVMLGSCVYGRCAVWETGSIWLNLNTTANSQWTNVRGGTTPLRRTSNRCNPSARYIVTLQTH